MMAEIDKRPATLIGDILYWPTKFNYIIAFDNLSRVMYYVECPRQTHNIQRGNLHIIKEHNGGVRLVVLRYFNPQMWCSARLSLGIYAWTLHRDVCQW